MSTDERPPPFFLRPFPRLVRLWRELDAEGERIDPWAYRLEKQQADIWRAAADGHISYKEAKRRVREATELQQQARQALTLTPDD